MTQIYQLFDSEERRRFKRNPIHLRALCIVNGDVGYNCIIHDFCMGGMYLEFDHEPRSSGLAPGAEVTISCTVPLEAERPDLFISGRIIRLMEDFCGISFINADSSAIDILLEYAGSRQTAQPDHRQHARTVKTSCLEDAQSKPRQSLIQACLDKASDQGMELARRFLDDCARHIEKRLDTGKDSVQQHALFCAREALGRQKSAFLQRFINPATNISYSGLQAGNGDSIVKRCNAVPAPA